MQQCEYYDRGCKLKQCFNCQQYGHIGSQCTATQACSYCAEAHNAKECEKRTAHPPAEPKCAVCNGKHTSWSNACKKRQEEQIKIKRALATRPGRHRTKDMGTENSGLQATSRNLQFNFGDFPRLAPQTESSQEPSGQLASKRQRSPTRKVVEGTQPKRRSVATTNRNNKRAAPSSIDPNGSVKQSMDWVPQSSASKDTSNATQEGQVITTPSATQSDTALYMTSKRTLSILQYNVQKSRAVMAPLLRDPAVLGLDIIAIQEPWRNPHQTQPITRQQITFT